MSEEGQIRTGSVVRLKSGGPAMTVTRRENACISDTVTCLWIDMNFPNGVYRESFPAACLTIVENAKPR